MALAGWKVGDEVKAFTWLTDLWRNLRTSDIWIAWWPFGKVSGFLYQRGIVDSSPMLEFLQKATR